MASLPPLNVRDFGAIGDGIALDSSAIQRALDAAADAGGGTVLLPAGTYPSFTLHLRSRVTLHLAAGATLLAATPTLALGGYDVPEPNPWGDDLQYQDFGHSHWRNSLLVGEELTDVAITGPGLIDGRGLDRHIDYPHLTADAGPNGTGAPASGTPSAPAPGPARGNKAIALRQCRHVTLRDFSLLRGGHFAVLATGCEAVRISGLRIDTNRDGLDLDACRDVHVADCTVNSPMDDAIVLKTSYALGKKLSCEHVVITRCTVSGFDVGTVLDGTYGRTTSLAPDRDGPTGRIKIGTESNGDFRHITVSDCTFQRSRGLALETVDGAVIEDVQVANLRMEEVTSAPIFLRLGNRARGPAGTPVGALRRIHIRNISARAVDGRFPILLAGLPGHAIEEITLENITIESSGGVRLSDVAAQDGAHVNVFFLRTDEPGVSGPRDPFAVPERPRAYPEPSMFGLLPAAGLYARHVRGLTLDRVDLTLLQPDERPRLVLDDVSDLQLRQGNLAPAASAP